MIDQFDDPSEKLLYAEKIKKISSLGISQQRVLVVTEMKIYLFEKMFRGFGISRRYPIGDLYAFMNTEDSDQLLLTF